MHRLSCGLLALALASGAVTCQKVLINEFLARNTKVIKDEKGQFEDWVELANTTNQVVDLGGKFLSDDPLKPTKWRIPTGTKIAANGTLLFWADEDKLDGPLHMNFKLSGTFGEEIFFVDSDGKTQLDHIKFGPQAADISTARLYDGKLKIWATLLVPTPRALNTPSTCGVRRYSALDSTSHKIDLAVIGAPKIASTITVKLDAGPPNSAFFSLWSVAPSAPVVITPRLSTLIGLPLLITVVPSNGLGLGSQNIPIPDLAGLVGQRLFLQAISIDAQGLFGSNAAEVTFCPK